MPCPDDQGELDPSALREIRLDEPQIMVDDYLVENRFDERKFSSTVPHVFHRAERPDSPVIVPDKPWEEEFGISHPAVIYDSRDDMLRMYYTVYQRERRGLEGYPPGSYFLCYAESRNGLEWRKPDLDLISWGNREHTNIIMEGEREAKIAHVHTLDEDVEGRLRNIGTLPPRFLREHRFLMYYCDHSHYLATSEDGINWTQKVHEVISNRIDCYHTIVHDRDSGEFVSFLRNRLIFGGKQPEEYFGNTRMICRVSSRDLWSRWIGMPSSVLIPDQGDSQRFYSMPTFIYGNIYWGFLHHLGENPQKMEVELVYSRDGLEWSRLPGRTKLISIDDGEEWDSGMVATGDRILEKGDEWWLYYTGYDGYHDETERQGSIGVLRFRKEGFVSVSAREHVSYLLTKPIIWPEGDLEVNARTDEGFLEVRVTDQRRNTVTHFSYDQCQTFEGDDVRHKVEWESGRMRELEGEVVRLEFKFRNCDLFSFVASSGC